MSLGDAALIVGLFEGRTRHLFGEHTGLPFRTYQLRQRLLRAVEMFATGASLTEAANGVGFAAVSYGFDVKLVSLRVGA